MYTEDIVESEVFKEWYENNEEGFNRMGFNTFGIAWQAWMAAKRITSDNSNYAKCADDIQEMCQNGVSKSDIIHYLQTHFA